jgi:Flp pilus assembly protein TadD
MGKNRLDTAAEHYANSIATLEQHISSLLPQQVLAALNARDNVHSALTDKVEDVSEVIFRVLELDARLKKQADLISKTVNLADWRGSLTPPEGAWWWSLDKVAHPSRWDRFDWLWNAVAVLLFMASLSFVIDISSRFLSGGPDTLGIFATVSQSALALLAAGGALTVAGREALQRILASIGVPKQYWQETKAGVALILLLGLIAFRVALPQIAVAYNNSGLDDYLAGRLSSAQYNYNRALKLNPDYAEAHYNLGLLYEDLQDFKAAKAEYQIAVRGSLDAAYNNLARLYIKEKDYAAAVTLLLTGLDLTRDTTVRYTMLKNLGWARIVQARFDEAKASLQEAIQLAPDKSAAHCLLAQALDGASETADALAEWNNCLQYARGRNLDEDAWIGMARAALSVKESGNEK